MSPDPWDAFVARAERAEVAGFFERAPGHSTVNGLCVWFDRGEVLPPVDRTSSIEGLARTTGRHLRAYPRGVVLGYLGFDAVGLFEPALARFPEGAPFPLGEFVLARSVHRTTTGAKRRIRAGARLTSPGRPLDDSLPRSQFGASVQRLRAAIRAGEAFQVVLSHRRSWVRPDDLLERAGRLRASERFAYFYYLKLGDRELVGASPESVVEVEGGRAHINPIAGTIPRGRPRGRGPLRDDPKELAEHRMLVDLARNDLGRCARPGSVRVLWKERRVRYARLEHLVSRVTARLPKGVGPWDVLRATFPAGTVSGAPKIRATEWLRRQEQTWRGPYAGTVGLLRPGGRADWALAIRGGFAAGRRLFTAAGAGVVYGSRPAREFDETLVKLAHVEQVLVGGAR